MKKQTLIESAILNAGMFPKINIRRKIMKTRKRFTAILLTLVLLAGCIPVSALADRYPQYNGNSCSIVDALSELGIDASFSFRERIAEENDIPERCGNSSYSGKGEENALMVRLLREGSLRIPSSSSASSGPQKTSAYSETCDMISNTSNTVSRDTLTCVEANVKNGAAIRSGPYQESTVIAKAPYGTVLYVKEPFVNSRGNLWYKICYGDGEAYIFSERVREHIHDFCIDIKGTDGDYHFCSCGAYECDYTENADAKTLGYAAALSDQMINVVRLLAAAESMGAAATTAGAAVAAAGEAACVAIVAVAGVYVIVELTEYSAETRSITLAKEKYYDLDDDDMSLYHPAKVDTWTKGIFIDLSKDSMNLQEAVEFVEKGIGKNPEYNSVYTLTDVAALALCEALASKGYDYGTSESNASDHRCEADNPRAGKPETRLLKWNGFYHYHVKGAPNSCVSPGAKIQGVHIFLGLPQIMYNEKAPCQTA